MTWKLHDDGNIALTPLTGWELGTGYGMMVIARLEFSPREEDLLPILAGRKEPGAVQLALTPAQCRELAQVLLRKADTVENPPAGTPKQS